MNANDKSWRPLFWWLIGVFVVWILFGIFTYIFHNNWSNRADFGDMFGAVNSLFSGFAFAVLIYTMRLQREELELQRKELEETREELKRAADAHEASQRAFDKQIDVLGRSRQMSALLKVYEVWMERDFRDALVEVLAREPNPSGILTEEDRRKAKELCQKIDQFAQLAPFVGQSKILELFDDPLGKAWWLLNNIVAEERASSGWPAKWKAFEDLGGAALNKLIADGHDFRPRSQRLQPSASHPMSVA